MASDTKDIRGGDLNATRGGDLDVDAVFDDRVKAVAAAGAAIHILKFACMKYHHIKRGTQYHRIGEARLQSSEPITEGQRLTVYVGEDGQLWARPVGEFHDGRFEPVL